VKRVPDFDELIGNDLPEEERERLRRTHELLVQAGPPAELSPELEKVPWPDESLAPLWPRRRKQVTQRPLVIAATLAAAVLVGVMLGRASGPSDPSTSIDAVRSVELRGTALDPDAVGTLHLGSRDRNGNWDMVLQVRGLDDLGEGGYYDLYLTRGGEPTVLCGTFNAKGRREVTVRLNAAYDLSRFDRNGWVVTRQPSGHHEPDQIVLRPSSA
jgi:hypothetical protein